jgi:type I restriction enzyme, S subunit
MTNFEPFGKLLENVVDNRGKTCPTAESGLPLIATNCISNDYLYPQFIKVRYVDDDTYKNWFRAHPKPGDMIFVLKGTPGQVAWVSDPVNFCIAQDMVAIRADQELVYPKYLFAALRSKIIQQKIERLHVGSLIPHFKKGDFNNLLIPIPDIKTQRFIGNQYFNLSLKIDLLHRQNETLEALAQTLFRQWFLEEVEDDWIEGVLGDLVEFNYGKGLKKSKRTGIGYPVVGSSGVVDYHSEYLVEGPGIVTGRKGTLGKVIYLSENFYPIDTTFFIRTKNNSPNLYYEYFLLKSIGFENMNTDSAVPGLNRSNALSVDVIIPPQSIITLFNDFVHPLFQKRKSNKTQIYTLEELRDTLLPKMMNGEVWVKEGSTC